MKSYNIVIAPKDFPRLERSTAKAMKRCVEALKRMDQKFAIRQRKIEADLEEELFKLNLLEFV